MLDLFDYIEGPVSTLSPHILSMVLIIHEDFAKIDKESVGRSVIKARLSASATSGTPPVELCSLK